MEDGPPQEEDVVSLKASASQSAGGDRSEERLKEIKQQLRRLRERAFTVRGGFFIRGV